MENMNRNFKTFALLRILWKETDSRHGIGTGEIMGMLDEQGLGMSRPSVIAGIQTLIDSGFDIRTENPNTPHTNYRLYSRLFGADEIASICDMIMASRYFSVAEAERICEKLSRLISDREAKLLPKPVAVMGRKADGDGRTLEVLSVCRTALKQGRRIEFRYIGRDEAGAAMLRNNGDAVSAAPVTLIYQNDVYYLAAEVPDGIKTYRLDRMADVGILPKLMARTPEAESFDPSGIVERAVSMFGGEDVRIVFYAHGSSVCGSVFDYFKDRPSCNAEFEKADNDVMKVQATMQSSPTLYSWFVQYGKDVYIASPEKTVRDFRRFIAEDVLRIQGEAAFEMIKPDWMNDII